MSAQNHAAANRATPAFSYDEVPYESFTYAQTHPYHLYTIASLFGLSAPNFKTARVLELGCASGGNLFSLAIAYPQAHFTGIDLSQEQIDGANQAKASLGLANIDFMQADILRFDTKVYQGKFDYIICHGVLSWVPEIVREKIFVLCQECLSPDGLAVISYNTLPGWNAVRSLREMMLFHSGRFNTSQEKIKQSRLLLDFLAENVSEGRSGYSAIIEDERNILKHTNDSYLFHDHLEQINSQFYFHEFVSMAGKNNLQYVGDSMLTTMFVGNMPQKAMDALQTINDVVLQEQYMDFINNRRFRTSILCKDGKTLSRQLKTEAIMNYHLTSIMKPTGQTNPKEGIRFSVTDDNYFTTHHEMAGVLFLELAAAGNKPIAAKDLVSQTAARLKLPDSKQVESILIQHGINLALRGFIALHSDTPDYVTTLSEKPIVFPLARYQATQAACLSVTNKLHAMIQTDGLSNVIIQQLDGTKRPSEVIDHLTGMAIDGKIAVHRENVLMSDKNIIREEITKTVNLVLEKLSQQALLVG